MSLKPMPSSKPAAPPSPSAPATAGPDAAELEAIAGCEAVDLLLPDMNGLLRGKRVTREALEKVYVDGVCLPGGPERRHPSFASSPAHGELDCGTSKKI